ncbi:MAG: response regulator [Cyanothece sp. SIO1E1]|nr:response regulator [Cyanothece sp. SIO1E1]
MDSPGRQSKADILIVDDEADNIRLLSTILKERGYKVRQSLTGQLAIMAAKAAPPSLILLDVNMPGINGYEVCQALKAAPTTSTIPVIFISALDGVLDKVKAFQVGGVDYIAKPFHLEEVLVRVENQLMIQSQQQLLRDQSDKLKQEIAEHQQTEAALRQMEMKYRQIFENAAEGIFQITLERQYMSANPALARIFGYDSPEELMACITDIGRQLYVRPKRLDELLAYMRIYDEGFNFESEVYRKDGSMIWVSENMRVVRDEDGTVLCYEGTVQDITQRRQAEEELRLQRLKSERLLLNMLPQKIAERLKRGHDTIASSFDEVTVLFADLVNFTQLSARIAPKDLVGILNEIFSAFDQLSERYGLEKIKTIGDAYMVVGGMPTVRSDHAKAIAAIALDMQQEITRFRSDLGEPFQLRIGINSGPVIAGVIGTKKFNYDLWGDTVNVASRMESQGQPGRIQVTEATYKLLRDQYDLERRGEIDIRGKGGMTTYWLLGKKAVQQ